MFFTDYPQFQETSQVGPSQSRLNLRYEAIFEANRDVFAGARVLDMACNDGRWSFAALKTGASHVTGVEARPELCTNANATMAHYGMSPDDYEFICGDVLEVLEDKKFDVDVVLCLGYVYHTYRHTELLHYLRALEPKHLIMDSHVIAGEERPVVKVKTERPDPQGTAVLDPFAHEGKTVVGLPSLSALVDLLKTYGFGVEEMFDWPRLLAAHPEASRVGDYRDGWRVTLRCRTGADTSPSLPASPPVAVRSRGWREDVNRLLERTTGYHLARSQEGDRGRRGGSRQRA